MLLHRRTEQWPQTMTRAHIPPAYSWSMKKIIFFNWISCEIHYFQVVSSETKHFQLVLCCTLTDWLEEKKIDQCYNITFVLFCWAFWTSTCVNNIKSSNRIFSMWFRRFNQSTNSLKNDEQHRCFHIWWEKLYFMVNLQLNETTSSTSKSHRGWMMQKQAIIRDKHINFTSRFSFFMDTCK